MVDPRALQAPIKVKTPVAIVKGSIAPTNLRDSAVGGMRQG